MTVRAFFIGGLAVLAAALAAPAPTFAADPTVPDPSALAAAGAERFVTPRFKAVADAAAAQSKAWEKVCAAPTQGGVDVLKSAFAATADAWAGVDFVRMGPASTQMRTERFNYWIDRSNGAGKALNGLLAAPDESGLTPAALTGSSAAGQGLPVLERLLWDDGAAGKLAARTPDGARRCAIGRAVARNLADISGVIAAEWGGPDGVTRAMQANKAWGVYFTNGKEAGSVLLTDLVIGIENLKDNELAFVFHDEANPAAVRLAEQWRSGRSFHDAELKYAALKSALRPFLSGADSATRGRLDAAFADADAKMTATGKVMQSSPPHSPERTAALQATMASMGSLLEALMTGAPAASGIPLGFNSLDGD